MRNLPVTLLGIFIGVVLLVACSDMLNAKSKTNTPPATIAPCPDYPRCVSTEAQKPNQRMAPIHYEGGSELAQERLRKIIRSMPRATITTDMPGYLAAQFKSRLIGFTDDVEFLFDPRDFTIHFRSGARVGYYDFGVNRSRMEFIAQALQAP